MNRLAGFLLLSTIAITGVVLVLTRPMFGITPNPTTNDVKPDESSFAVLELFTSEGCSSCPPADALFAEVLQQARKQNKRVYGLSFHVDYWNRLGWNDPFSNKEYTRRQRDYARAFTSRRVYTPQLVVNGTTEFVGSDRNRLSRNLAKALGLPERTQVKLELKPAGKSKLVVLYAVTPTKNSVLNVALVERDLQSQVTTGENAQRTLHHTNVVRAFRIIDLSLSAKGKVELEIPQGIVRKKASVIAYVQEKRMGAVTGASEAPIPDGK
ncbi:MAG: DUF1223 domain-containing protein [Gemmataceae bacterium]